MPPNKKATWRGHDKGLETKECFDSDRVPLAKIWCFHNGVKHSVDSLLACLSVSRALLPQVFPI